MVIVDQDEGGGSGAEVGSVAAQPVLVNVRPPARLIERATAECAGRVELPSSITTNGAQVALADAQPADGGGDHELARAVVLRPAPGRAKPAPSSVTYVEQGDHLVVLGVRDVSEPVLAVGPAGEPDGCLAAINATWRRPCSAGESPLRRTCPRRCWSARFMAASTASWSRGER
jgi:hypothetical protein